MRRLTGFLVALMSWTLGADMARGRLWHTAIDAGLLAVWVVIAEREQRRAALWQLSGTKSAATTGGDR